MLPMDDAANGEEGIREQLDRILGSPSFQVPDRGRHFLRYVVAETLEGRSEQLNVHAIAKAVFDRGVGFDANSDPVVRVEAGRVRRALERYYLISGRHDPIIITIPKGRYEPRFERAGQGTAVSASAGESDESQARQKNRKFSYRDLLVPLGVPAVFAALTMLALIRPLETYLTPAPVQQMTGEKSQFRIVVERFAALGGIAEGSGVARSLSDQLVLQLSKVNGVVVLDPSHSVPASTAVTIFTLQGSISRGNDLIRVQARLVAGTNGRIVWAQRFESQTEGRNIIDLQAEICTQIVKDLAAVPEIGASALTR